jgi:hypothetical protein
MTEDQPRHLVILALLAVLVGAVVNVAQATGTFTPWESIVGLIMLFTARAFGDNISSGRTYESIAFSMIMGAAILFCIGFLVDQFLLYLEILKINPSDPARYISKRGYFSSSEQDEFFFLLWIALTSIVWALRSIGKPS